MKIISAADAWDFDEGSREKFEKKFDFPIEDVLREGTHFSSPDSIYRIVKLTVKSDKGYIYIKRAVVLRNEEILYDIHHDYMSLPHHFFYHPDGNTYLLIPWHYEHMALINLTTGDVKYYKDDYWCFTHAVQTKNPDGRYVLLAGCYWAAPYELRYYGVIGGELHMISSNWAIGRDSPDDGSENYWTEDGVVMPYMAYEGRDGTSYDDDEWDDKMWKNPSHYSDEALANFKYWALVRFGVEDGIVEDYDITLANLP